MKQEYHSNATTNVHIRNQINGSNLKNCELSDKYSVSEPTITKWKKRNFFHDKSSRPHKIHYSLNDLERLLVTQIRRLSWWALDEIVELIFPKDYKSKRSAVYRTFVREKINKVPLKEKEKAKKFKEYQPGYLHVDVTYLPKIDGIKYYLFVAIDRATRALFYKVYKAKTATNTELFINECFDFFPFEITHILTDNGLEFTNRLIKSKKGKLCDKESKLDKICKEKNIDHRLTKPATPKTNGMVERVNATIKNATIKKSQYSNKKQMVEHLNVFLVNYNIYRRHGGLRKELNVKTPFNAIEKWYRINPQIFKRKPEEFFKKILSLKPK